MHENLHKKVNENKNMFLFTFISFYEGQLKQQML